MDIPGYHVPIKLPWVEICEVVTTMSITTLTVTYCGREESEDQMPGEMDARMLRNGPLCMAALFLGAAVCFEQLTGTLSREIIDDVTRIRS